MVPGETAGLRPTPHSPGAAAGTEPAASFASCYLYEGFNISNFQSNLEMPNSEGRLKKIRSLQKWRIAPSLDAYSGN